MGSHLNENGQKKITNCLRTGLRDLTRILESRANDSAATNKLFEFIGCDGSKPQHQQKDGSKKNNQKPLKRNNGRQQANNTEKMTQMPNDKDHTAVQHDDSKRAHNGDGENLQKSHINQRNRRNNKKSNGRKSPPRLKSDFLRGNKGGNNSRGANKTDDQQIKKIENTTLNAIQQMPGHPKTSKQSRQSKPQKNGKPRHQAKNNRNHNGSKDLDEANAPKTKSNKNGQKETGKGPKHDTGVILNPASNAK